MIDYAAARRTMVENQLRTYDVTDQPLLASFEIAPREKFVAAGQGDIAYLDRELTACSGARMLTPMVLARLLQALEVVAGQRVLDVGGAGYGAALLKTLGAEVVALETDAAPVVAALAGAGVAGVEVVQGALDAGAAAKGPFDLIVVHGSSDVAPDALCAQLKTGGRLAMVMGRGRSGRATIFRKTVSGISHARAFDASAPVLPDFAAKPAFQF